MSYLLKTLITASIVAFIIAVLEAVFNFAFLGVGPEGYSRACTNIALIAIALKVCQKPD